MKRMLLLLVFALALVGGAGAQEAAYYGLASNTLPPAENISALGSGKSGYMAALVALDPALDPVMQRLKGRQILGVRCYLRAAYKQKSQKRSYVMLCNSTPDDMVRQQYVNFEEGWNDVYFDEPYTVGDEKVFIGMQVYETTGTPYPVVTQTGISIPGGCYTNVARTGWNEFTDRGVLLVQAILPAEATAALERSAYVKATDYPLLVEPSQPFSCKLFVHNLSAQPLNALQLSTQGTGDEEPRSQTLTLTTPVAPYEAVFVPTEVFAGSAEGSAQQLSVQATAFNGEDVQPAMPGECQLFVTREAFTRVPLVEEFTSQYCTNCPFMAYYLDKAIEEYEKPVLYIARHSGYQDDFFTQPVDKELIYLFGPDYGPDYKWAYNPAVMYDRTILKGETLPVYGAKEPSSEPYLAAIREAASYPAMAQVEVEADKNDDGLLEVRVHGRVHHDLVGSDEPIYISTYLVEDGITTEVYFQEGLDVDDAPADLLDRFRHNGVIRHNFCTVATGDVLTPNADATFSVTYPAASLQPYWNWDNCRVISYVHRINKADLADNVILNAGSNKLEGGPTAIHAATRDEAASLRVWADGSRRLRTSQPVEAIEVYDPSGRQVNATGSQQPGIYVVRATLAGGAKSSQVILVR